MSLSDDNKWEMVKGYQAMDEQKAKTPTKTTNGTGTPNGAKDTRPPSLAEGTVRVSSSALLGRRASSASEGSSGDITETAQHAVQVLHLEPTASSVEELANMLRTVAEGWIEEFIELDGVAALTDLMEVLEKKAFKTAVDFQTMSQCLRCLRALMNVDKGMAAILGLSDGKKGGLLSLVMGIDVSTGSVKSRKVQCQSLTLLAAAAVYSSEGHKQVLAALEEHRKKRRKATRFGYLVDECSKTESFAEVDVGFSIAAAVAGMKKKGMDSSTDTPKAKREAQTEVVTSCLILINSIISHPDVLRERVQLRGEFLRLNLVEVMQELHLERRIEVLKQIDIFEHNMEEDNKEIGKLAAEERKTMPAQPESLELDHNGAISDEMKTSETVGTPILRLQEKVLTHYPKALPRLMSVLDALAELPNTDDGLAAWVACEASIVGLMRTVKKNVGSSAETLKRALATSLPVNTDAEKEVEALKLELKQAKENGNQGGAGDASSVELEAAKKQVETLKREVEELKKRPAAGLLGVPPPPPIAGGVTPPPPPIPGGAPPPPPIPGGAPPPPPIHGGAPPPPPIPGGAPPPPPIHGGAPPPPPIPGGAPPPPPIPGGAPPPPPMPGGVPPPPPPPGGGPRPPPPPPGAPRPSDVPQIPGQHQLHAVGAGGYRKKPPMKASVPMKQLHWSKINDPKIKGTIWELEVKDEKVRLNEEELEDLFCAKKTVESSVGGGGAAEKKKSEGPVTLVDPKTANNTAIAISRFKMSPAQICENLKLGKVEAFTVDQITALLGILPTAEDVETCQGYKGDQKNLGKAEQFFLAVSSVPRYQIRTKCLQVRVTFDEKFGDCEEKILTVQKAAKQVRESKAFREVLKYTLACGNFLNGTSNKGCAWGFKLESLNKLKDTKTADNKSTMLHYIASRLDKEHNEDRMKAGTPPPPVAILEEMPDLEGAVRCIWKDQISELNQIKANLKQVATQVKLDRIEAFTTSMGNFHGEASKKTDTLDGVQQKTQKALDELKLFFGEDPKVEPEDVFGLLSNFAVTLEKAHKYNKAESAKAEKQKKLAEAKAARARAGS